MVKSNKTLKIVTYLLILIILACCAFYLFQEQKYFFGCCVMFFVFITGYGIIGIFNMENIKAEKIISSIQYNDYSLLPEKQGKERLEKMMIDLYYQQKAQYFSLKEERELYQNILDNVDIGLVILSKPTENNNWSVFFVNQYFLDMLNVPRYSHWNLYKDKIGDLWNVIERTGYKEIQDSFEISVNMQENQAYSFKTATWQTQNRQFFVISLDSVQKIVERKEKRAWYNLMEVISHELMNTLTPINSLIENLNYLVKQPELDKDDIEELRESLARISQKSSQLISFVSNYRKLVELPHPKNENVELSDLIRKAVETMQPLIKAKSITISSQLKPIYLNADKELIERVLINLLTNSIYALENIDNPTIEIKSFTKENRAWVSIEDNGQGIDKKIRDKIFMPFFTTRVNGAGIGLALSKSIMEAHNGYLTFQGLDQGVRFEMCFVL